MEKDAGRQRAVWNKVNIAEFEEEIRRGVRGIESKK